MRTRTKMRIRTWASLRWFPFVNALYCHNELCKRNRKARAEVAGRYDRHAHTGETIEITELINPTAVNLIDADREND